MPNRNRTDICLLTSLYRLAKPAHGTRLDTAGYKFIKGLHSKQKFLGHLNAIEGYKYDQNHSKQVHSWQTKPKYATKGEFYHVRVLQYENTLWTFDLICHP